MCEECLRLIPTKIIVEDDQNIFYQKRCPEHGVQKTLISTDFAYFKSCKDYFKPGDIPQQFQTRTDHGCPYDCGLCPDHEQHSCLAILEVNEACNLKCPMCFADSSPEKTTHLPLVTIEKMLDKLVESEGFPDLLQISGGEPTIHPEIINILKAAKKRPIRHLMVNTNGIRLSTDKEFVKSLAQFKPGFEVYLQFDSLREKALKNIRGANLLKVREKALKNLEEEGISTTLVCTLKKGINDDEVGDIIRHALKYRCVRGITFQTIQDTGRNLNFDGKKNRLLLSEVRRNIIDQSGIFSEEDVLPLPCNPEAITIAYGLRQEDQIIPVTKLLPRDLILKNATNTVTFEHNPTFKNQLFDMLSLSSVGEATESSLQSFLCCLPEVEAPSCLTYENVFRVAVVQFMDRFNFCIAGVKRSCIHFLTPHGKIIPFDTYNLFYRPGMEHNLAQSKAKTLSTKQVVITPVE